MNGWLTLSFWTSFIYKLDSKCIFVWLKHIVSLTPHCHPLILFHYCYVFLRFQLTVKSKISRPSIKILLFIFFSTEHKVFHRSKDSDCATVLGWIQIIMHILSKKSQKNWYGPMELHEPFSDDENPISLHFAFISSDVNTNIYLLFFSNEYYLFGSIEHFLPRWKNTKYSRCVVSAKIHPLKIKVVSAVHVGFKMGNTKQLPVLSKQEVLPYAFLNFEKS